MKTKIAIFAGLLLLMIAYIGWIFYMSEPHYIDNAKLNEQYKIERYDVVSTVNGYNQLSIGLIIQIDSVDAKETRATVKNFVHSGYGDDYTNIHLKKNSDTTFITDYRIIGKGTFYHKVNSWIGFNIMMITTIVIMIIAMVVLVTLIGLLRKFFGFNPIF